MKNNETKIQWLQNELKRDEEDLEREKLDFISEIKKFKKQDLIPKPEKLTLWQRIKTVLKMS
jgi:hypothetical protein